MICEDWQQLILDEEYLNETQRQDLDRHLSNCTSCHIWANALVEVETYATDQLQAEINLSALRERVFYALARQNRQSWMATVPELLDALGWSALGVVGMIGLSLLTNRASWVGNHLLWMGAAAVVGSVAWATAVLSKEESERRPLL